MENKFVLTKESGKEEVKKYFTAVLELSKSSEEFPVNLDEVWMLVYSEKGKAVRALTTNEQFIEGIDYKVLSRNAENSLAQNGKQDWGGNNRIDYYLSVPCLEFFIARKVRSVFEVYRQVFHHVVQGMLPTPNSYEDKVRGSLAWVDGIKSLLNLSNAAVLNLTSQVAEPLGLPVPESIKSEGALLSARDLLKKHNVGISSQAFNKLAEANGLLETLYRTDSKGKQKPFKNITKEGLEFGENRNDKHNLNETHPEWYVALFAELLEKLGIITNK